MVVAQVLPDHTCLSEHSTVSQKKLPVISIEERYDYDSPLPQTRHRTLHCNTCGLVVGVLVNEVQKDPGGRGIKVW